MLNKIVIVIAIIMATLSYYISYTERNAVINVEQALAESSPVKHSD